MKDRRKSKKLRSSDNRRSKKRIYAECDVTAFINDKEYSTKMRNISGNGMQILEPPDVEIQTRQECYILIQDGNTSIKLEALVVWQNFGLLGLCFKKQSPKTQKQLNKLSETLLLTAVTDVDIANLL
jgi:PilZ domain-containing protein